MNDKIQNYYRTLDLENGASLEEVKQARRDLAKVWHPDRWTHDPKMQRKANEKLKDINQAFEELEIFLAISEPPPPPRQTDPKKYPPRHSTAPPPQDHSTQNPNNLKMTCNQCGGVVEFPEESEGATVPCPHCQKNILLYRSNNAFNSKHGNENTKQQQETTTAKKVANFQKRKTRIIAGLTAALSLMVGILTATKFSDTHQGNLTPWVITFIAMVIILMASIIVLAGGIRIEQSDRDEAKLWATIGIGFTLVCFFAWLFWGHWFVR